MRISDWSSDVCSSDLHSGEQQIVGFGHRAPDVVGDAVADLPFVEKFACHGQSLRCSFMPTWLWTKPSRAEKRCASVRLDDEVSWTRLQSRARQDRKDVG